MRERDIERKRQEVRRLFALFKLCCCCLRQKGVKSCACARRRCPLRVHRQSESTAAAERANELQLLAIRASVCLRVCVCVCMCVRALVGPLSLPSSQWLRFGRLAARHLNVFFELALSIRVRNSCELVATFCLRRCLLLHTRCERQINQTAAGHIEPSNRRDSAHTRSTPVNDIECSVSSIQCPSIFSIQA